MRPFWITTSWDDGHPLDLRIAALLSKYKLTGTFYVARDYLDQRLTDQQIIDLSVEHEIGAHTLNHPALTTVDLATSQREIVESRHWLEMVTGQPITAFCYPRGDYNAVVEAQVAQAGYAVARTVEAYRLDAGTDPLTLPTTLHVYPFPLRPTDSIRARFQPIQRLLPQVWRLRLPIRALRSWQTLAIALLERAAITGGVWHLWGHSWEVDRYGMWDALESVLASTRHYPTAQPVTNSQLVKQLMPGTIGSAAIAAGSAQSSDKTG